MPTGEAGGAEVRSRIWDEAPPVEETDHWVDVALCARPGILFTV